MVGCVVILFAAALVVAFVLMGPGLGVIGAMFASLL